MQTKMFSEFVDKNFLHSEIPRRGFFSRSVNVCVNRGWNERSRPGGRQARTFCRFAGPGLTGSRKAETGYALVRLAKVRTNTLSPPTFTSLIGNQRTSSRALKPFTFFIRNSKSEKRGADKNVDCHEGGSNENFLEFLAGIGTEPYMGGVHILEDDEQPAKYVQAPPIPEEFVKMRNGVENVMYTLKDVIPGPLASFVNDKEKWLTVTELFSDTVEVQNPLFCLRGKKSLEHWLKVLAESEVALDLHEIFYESIATNRFSCWVYAIWTAALPKKTVRQLRHHGQLTKTEVTKAGLEDQDGNGDEAEDEQIGKENHVLKKSLDSFVQLSGETRFEIDRSEQVTSVHTRWYKIGKVGDGDLATAKIWVSALINKEL